MGAVVCLPASRPSGSSWRFRLPHPKRRDGKKPERKRNHLRGKRHPPKRNRRRIRKALRGKNRPRKRRLDKAGESATTDGGDAIPPAKRVPKVFWRGGVPAVRNNPNQPAKLKAKSPLSIVINACLRPAAVQLRNQARRVWRPRPTLKPFSIAWKNYLNRFHRMENLLCAFRVSAFQTAHHNHSHKIKKRQ